MPEKPGAGVNDTEPFAFTVYVPDAVVRVVSSQPPAPCAVESSPVPHSRTLDDTRDVPAPAESLAITLIV